MRFKNIIINVLHHSGISYPVPSNITYWWNFGVLALLCLVIQLLTGIFLAMHYVANADLAFASVEHIMRDINNGWLLRYMHANGASMFFLVVYVHLFRNLYYGSYSAPRQILWCTGVIILLIMILTAFMGYVLPWGQMSFWAATVITNLVSAVPYVGTDILNWLWGGYAVDNATLNRFFSFHYLLPFVLTGLVGCHIVYLHENGSNNALGIIFNNDKIPFTPYFTIKDIYGIVLFFIFFSYFIFFDPVYLGHPDNFIAANPLVTPNHIVPEWYFLPFYAILRSVPDKLIGVLLLLASILVLLLFPFITKQNIVSGYLRPLYQKFFWLFFFNCILLGWIGGKAIEEPYYLLGQLFTIYYFSYFLIIIPFLSFLEKNMYSYSINKSNLKYLEKQISYNFINVNNYLNNKTSSITKDITKAAYDNNKFFWTSVLLLIAYNQTAFLYGTGDRIPSLLTFFVMFFFYNLFISSKLLNLEDIYYYKKNVWFISYFFIKNLLNNIYLLFLARLKQNYIYIIIYNIYKYNFLEKFILEFKYFGINLYNQILFNSLHYYLIKTYIYSFLNYKHRKQILLLSIFEN